MIELICLGIVVLCLVGYLASALSNNWDGMLACGLAGFASFVVATVKLVERIFA